jgi:hypothetical protein
MRSTLGALAVAAALFAGYSTMALDASTGPIPLNCDRACLEGVMNQYLAAVVAHDPTRRCAVRRRRIPELSGDEGRRRLRRLPGGW